MNTQLRRTSAVVGVIAATFSAYAVAQHAPAGDKAPPAHTHEAGPKHESCMHGDCMHGGDMGQGGCPMMALTGAADARVEKTKDGALIRLSVKDPAKVEEVQRLAEMIAKRFEAKAKAPAAHGAHSHQH